MKLSIKSFTENYFKVLFICIPLAVYSLPLGFVNISIDRLLLLVGLFLMVPLKLSVLKKPFNLVLLLLVSTFLSIFFSKIDYVLLVKFLPSWIQSLIIFVVSTSLSFYFREKLITKVLYFQLIIIFFFVVYGIWNIFYLKNLYYELPFPSFLPDILDDKHKLGMMGNMRLFFPFSSAPRLGFVGGFLFLFFLLNPWTKIKLKYIFCFMSAIIVVFSISRGPIVSVLFVLFIGYILKRLRNGKFHVIFVTIPIFLSLALLLFINQSFDKESKFARLTNLSGEDASFQGHLGVRLKVVDMIFSDLSSETFFGYGVAQTQRVLNVSSAHSSYFTILLEQGVIGLFIFISVFLMILFRAYKLWQSKNCKLYYLLLIISLYLFFIHFTYDAISMTILWFYNGLTYGLILSKKIR